MHGKKEEGEGIRRERGEKKGRGEIMSQYIKEEREKLE